ncbi:DUF2304 domain-containing protein [Cryobacterium sp. Y82]|uniref:DUF2304 domain-containing protein n=1 Tax=Cryobacterium sp. Y82 TaxID=2045017 RepID=UPI000CE513B5|nr:DUF2304 domain-containing protein [Cryobacterium sp. Y82]
MTVTSYIFGILSALVALAVVVELLRRRQLRERHAMWWLFAGTMALIVGVFPKTLEWASEVVGIDVPTNLVFFVSIAILVLVCLQHSAELTVLESKSRTLAESVAMQDLRLRDLENQASNKTTTD